MSAVCCSDCWLWVMPAGPTSRAGCWRRTLRVRCGRKRAAFDRKARRTATPSLRSHRSSHRQHARGVRMPQEGLAGRQVAPDTTYWACCARATPWVVRVGAGHPQQVVTGTGHGLPSADHHAALGETNRSAAPPRLVAPRMPYRRDPHCAAARASGSSTWQAARPPAT